MRLPQFSLGSTPTDCQEFEQELGAQLKPLPRDPGLKDVRHLLAVVYGTRIKALARIAEALSNKPPSLGQAKAAEGLHTYFQLESGVPERIDVTGGSRPGGQDEWAVLAQHLTPTPPR